MARWYLPGSKLEAAKAIDVDRTGIFVSHQPDAIPGCRGPAMAGALIGVVVCSKNWLHSDIIESADKSRRLL
jgi:hypothetical protein